MKVFIRTLFSAQARKAWGGAIIVFLTGVQAAMGEGGTFPDISPYEWLSIAIGTLGALGLVYSLPNAKAAYFDLRRAGSPRREPRSSTYLELFAGKAPGNEPPATLNVTGTSTESNP